MFNTEQYTSVSVSIANTIVGHIVLITVTPSSLCRHIGCVFGLILYLPGHAGGVSWRCGGGRRRAMHGGNARLRTASLLAVQVVCMYVCVCMCVCVCVCVCVCFASLEHLPIYVYYDKLQI